MIQIKKALLSLSSPQKGLVHQMFPFELQLLGEKTVLERFLDLLIQSKVEEVILVGPESKEAVMEYWELLQQQRYENLEIRFVTCTDGNCLREMKKYLSEPFFYFPTDKLFGGSVSVFAQLEKMFRTASKCVAGLTKGQQQVGVEKIARHLYKIKDIQSAPEEGFTFSGYFVLTPEIFGYLEQDRDLSDALGGVIQQGENVYGSQIQGRCFDLSDEEGIAQAQLYYLQQ